MLMKKLITLLLAVAGMVSTVSADSKTIYFVNNWSKTGLRIHKWGGDGETNWPGIAFPSAESTKIDGYDVYALDLGTCSGFQILYTNDSEDYKEYNDKVEYIETLSTTVRKCADYSAGSLNNGDYIDFSNWNSGKPTLTGALTVYTYNFTVKTSTSWSIFKMALWNNSNSESINGFGFPGKEVTGASDIYSYTHKSFIPELGVLFADDSSSPTLKTGDLTAVPGNNKYYISTLTKDGGQGVKTNAYGYATAVSTGNLNMTSGIAYVAENMGNWAKAHTILGIKYGNPFLVWGEANTTYCFANGSEKELPCTNAFVKGSNTGVASGEGPYNYILNGNMFKAANGQNVASTKAYLQLTNQVPAGARALRFNDDEDVAGITSTTLSQVKEQVYDLQGRSVAQPTKGFYIVNGKKVIMK